jgi:hypothetical protein
MRQVLASLGFLALLALVGCGAGTTKVEDPLEISGTITLDGKPLTDVNITFLPTASGQIQGSSVVKKDGKFAAKVMVGKYNFIVEGNKSVPEKYTKPDTNHNIEVPSGGSTMMEIKLTK